MALARALAFDLYGTNARFANEANPSTATVAGLLPRWEVILGCPPNPGDAQPTRQARCGAALLRFGRPNNSQPVIDALTTTLGPLFVGLTLFTPASALVWWPAYGGSAAAVTQVSGNLARVEGLTNVPTAAPGALLVLGNASHAGNDGTFPVKSWLSPSSVVVVNNGSPAAPDYGIGGSSGGATIAWTMPNPAAPFLSTVAHVDVLVNPTATPGYVNPDGSLNGKFFQAVAQVNPLLDLLLPADCDFAWYVLGAGGTIGWYLDQPDLDLLIIDA